jgi:hypothetical protein
MPKTMNSSRYTPCAKELFTSKEHDLLTLARKQKLS